MKVKTNFNSCVIVQANEIDNKGTWTVLFTAPTSFFSEGKIIHDCLPVVWKQKQALFKCDLFFLVFCL